jgi:putative transposase
MNDHVHSLVQFKPTHRLADVLRGVKASSSEWLHRSAPRFHWQDGYAAFTVGRSEMERTARYIDLQQEHHRSADFADELRRLLRANDVAFEERYLL